MGSTSEIVHEFLPHFRAYKDGRIERYFGLDKSPASITSPNGVSSKDVAIISETGVSARIFIPSTINQAQKLPLLVYFHGGVFVVGSPFCSTYHNFVTSLVATANVAVVSVDYRLAPEHSFPAPYEDSWAALNWVASHRNGQGREAWLNDHADFGRVFMAGDSAGGNIVHNMMSQAGLKDLFGEKLSGICLIHPYFARKDGGVLDEFWRLVCPSGLDYSWINPAVDSRLSSLWCTRVLVCVAEEDHLRDRGVFYYETLKNSGWAGEMEIFETEGEKHVFHLFNPNCERALALVQKLASFLNEDHKGALRDEKTSKGFESKE
ncbi:Abhydrolase_3 domain-containing protein [Cephalotus follicularis]|uniref:Abhydrolase_3 domain-containing protein n=1 Tax=Cephalotus follicularis TaxID=3775 RepID=A0A1Q3C572_CEPFO|nr:Abhydrolase_3 domain-containing protein [Cephalotus follicularis]